ncbi:hypothetical protein HQQ82_13045 [Rathayibacter sp. VKM Ac-2856]|uniref:hypothetical protein n=1 Tax=unclassified Rathayibacter TaxID=2609250 RepID=UPI001563B111|nr:MULTISPECIES: hypothetical protein [unclassified Rathayibacter]NQX06146.1 hypothetical protein [Rathayibacter sp. VKM Ac-2858]NQX20904.1 hypothetical protein [Rathayibacter sp. VKM Ac-2856]
MRDVLRRSSGGEIAGAVLVVLAAIALVVSAFAYGAGVEIAFLGLLAAFAAGTTGLGVHIAGREARLRRDGD